jgi:hypothetical protein
LLVSLLPASTLAFWGLKILSSSFLIMRKL